ncbi:hypothetical protein NC651_013347 [Populus alba x Populus x berolinensis]|nr:hypothetical protein NC651_013347 [Populus alba x Populus x berolinensis]
MKNTAPLLWIIHWSYPLLVVAEILVKNNLIIKEEEEEEDEEVFVLQQKRRTSTYKLALNKTHLHGTMD